MPRKPARVATPCRELAPTCLRLEGLPRKQARLLTKRATKLARLPTRPLLRWEHCHSVLYQLCFWCDFKNPLEYFDRGLLGLLTDLLYCDTPNFFIPFQA